MPTTKQGLKEVRIVLEEGSETHITLLEWAKKRGLSPGKATRVIVTDWADAMNGRPNPFALPMIPAGMPFMTEGNPPQPSSQGLAPEMSPEEKARQAALLEAADQFSFS